MKKLLILFSCVLFAHGAFAWGQKLSLIHI